MKNDMYKSLLQESLKREETPSVDFTKNVMLKVEHVAASKKVYDPVISPVVFRVAGFLFVFMLAASFFMDMPESEPSSILMAVLSLFQSDVLKENLSLGFQLIFAFGGLFLTDILIKRTDFLAGLIKG